MATASPLQVGAGDANEDERRAALLQCLAEFTALWKQREGRAPRERLDFITALANAEATRDMDPMEYLGTLVLLIVGGNDTTRNSITGGVLALNENPAEYQKLRDAPRLIPNMVSEIIRWQTPLAHMRRTATQDAELAGKAIAKGDKVVLWYVSANRDEAVFERPNAFQIDRPNAKQHLAFGIGAHFCMGSRLAEMQLRVLWEEILARFRTIEVVEPPRRVRSNFVKGYSSMFVRAHRS
jgi:cytochrome P450